jgi:glycosyltransferase involved in cell wall biosynthesis
MGKKVSVIIPCFNQAQYLPEALNSVLSQTYSNWECIIVNDGSPDNTEEIALEWVAKDDRFKYLKKENGGVSDARNFGIRQSNGEYILPLDADDKIGNEYLENALQIFVEKSNVGVVYCEAEYFGAKTGKWYIPRFSKEKMLLANYVFCTALFKKEDYYKTNGFDCDLKLGWEDWDFWLSFIEIGLTFYQIPKVHFFYRIREDSRNQSVNEQKKAFIYKQIYLNHLNLFNEYLGTPVELTLKIIEISSSKEYRLGKILLCPFRKLKDVLVNQKE